MDLHNLFDEWYYVLILAGVMLVTGYVKQYNLFAPFYEFLIRNVTNKKLLVVLVSFLGGVLPVPGRVAISAGILDTMASDDPAKRSKFGIIDYLSTHHYYLWSPLEKTIIVPMAVLKLSYLAVLAHTWPLLLVSALFLIGYILKLDSNDIEIRSVDKIPMKPKTANKRWFQFINFKLLAFVFCLILAGNYVKESHEAIKEFINGVAVYAAPGNWGFIWLSITAFLGSLILGSSSKFAGMVSLLTSIFGMHYFTYLFALEYAGYLLSPFHKCVAIGMAYFKTPIQKYYQVIAIWCALLIGMGIASLLWY